MKTLGNRQILLGRVEEYFLYIFSLHGNSTWIYIRKRSANTNLFKIDKKYLYHAFKIDTNPLKENLYAKQHDGDIFFLVVTIEHKKSRWPY